MDYSKLREEINKPEYTGLSDSELADIFNDKNIEVTKDIDVIDIKKYLILTGKILPIKQSDKPSAMIAIEAMSTFSHFVMSDPLNAAALESQLDGLTSDSLITQDDKDAVLNMGKGFASKAEILGFNVTSGLVAAIRGEN